MDDSLSETLRTIEAEAEREGVALTLPARLILVRLAEAGGEAVVTKLWRLALSRLSSPSWRVISGDSRPLATARCGEQTSHPLGTPN